MAGRTENIGLGGAFVLVESPPPVGTKLVVYLAAATAWDALEITAEVRWVRIDPPVGMGIRFVDLTQSQIVALHDLLVLTGYGEGTYVP